MSSVSPPSFVVACRDNGLSDAAARDMVMTCVRTYRESMAEFSQMKTLELWYQALGRELWEGLKTRSSQAGHEAHREGTSQEQQAEEIFPKLVEHKGR